MRHFRNAIFAWVLVLSPVFAAVEEGPGEVRIPLDRYDNLVESAERPIKEPRPAPAGYAVGHAKIRVDVSEKEKNPFATIQVELGVEILEDQWVCVPILPSGTPLRSALVNGEPVELLTSETGLCWSVKTSGKYIMQLDYDVDAARSENGYSVSLPIPGAAAATLWAKIPGTGLDAAVIPSAGVRTKTVGEATEIEATVPTSPGVLLSWRIPGQEKPTISRAQYDGELVGDASVWSCAFQVELYNDETAIIPLLSQTVTLSDIRVDGKQASILVSDNRFAATVKGRGIHEVTADFQVPVIRQNGPPRIELNTPLVPISHIRFKLPGKKELSVNPAGHVKSEPGDDFTVTSVYVPMTPQVALSWTEAVPEDVKTELRANASIYHAVHAGEGVLYVRAMVVYEVTRGETNRIDLELPENVQINRIEEPSGTIADWRVAKGEEGAPDILSIFLDRKVKTNLSFSVYYDRSILDPDVKDNIPVPLLRARGVHRQRGMVALLAGKELTLKPVEEVNVTRIGENQLPAFVRQAVEMTIAHTFKYVEASPKLMVKATAPERRHGKFDALVNTLISLGDVTMSGSATVEINVKSGAISDLTLTLPPGVNFLSLTAPSLRTYTHTPGNEFQTVEVQFTQEMEGQFRVEVAYELIMADGAPQVGVPTITIRGAEVEQGRIAVEALTAVEVSPHEALHLSSLDPGELPRQLVLKTTNPILLAYKYAHIDPPYRLALTITRHKEIKVQAAAIDRAEYHTLYTKDGLAVTTAAFTVRNNREQFLRVRLPEDSKVWSAFVDGKPEKPALAQSSEKNGAGDMNVLIKIINSSQGFPVVLTYRTPVQKIGSMGTIEGTLPRPDMVVTQSRWEVYLPDDLRYGKPDGNMKTVVGGRYSGAAEMKNRIDALAGTNKSGEPTQPLNIVVPTAGIQFVFEKLYANQSDENAKFEISYVSKAGFNGLNAASALCAVLFWVGAGFLIRKKTIGAILAGIGILGIGIAFVFFRISPVPMIVVSAIAVAVMLVGIVKPRIKRAKGSERTEADKSSE